MDPAALLDHLETEAARLAVVARQTAPDAPVPSCPGWDLSGLVTHLARVYGHQIASMRLQRRPEEGEWATVPPSEEGVVEWMTATHSELVGELRSRGPEAPSYTWYPTDQTVGFWYRRMAQETLVHRMDAELAAGTPSPVDEALALDGIDEMLVKFLAGPWWKEEPVTDASGRTVAVRAGGEIWRVTLEREAVGVSRAEGPSDATVEGSPTDVLLWAWGREPSHVSVDGDAVTELRQRLNNFT